LCVNTDMQTLRWQPWTIWSVCRGTCGIGKQWRQLICIKTQSNGPETVWCTKHESRGCGSPCPGEGCSVLPDLS